MLYGETPIRLVLICTDIPTLKKKLKKFFEAEYVVHIDKPRYNRDDWAKTDKLIVVNSNQFHDTYQDQLGRRFFRKATDKHRGRTFFRSYLRVIPMFVNSIFITTPENHEKVTALFDSGRTFITYFISKSELRQFTINKFELVPKKEFDLYLHRYFALNHALMFASTKKTELRKVRYQRLSGGYGAMVEALLSYADWSDEELKHLALYGLDKPVRELFRSIKKIGLSHGKISNTSVASVSEEEWQYIQFSGLFKEFIWVDWNIIHYQIYPVALSLLDFLFSYDKDQSIF
jgi:hypothetical protein